MKKKKVLFISSTGGHFNELMQLKPMFEKYDYHIITEKDKLQKVLKNNMEKGFRIWYMERDHIHWYTHLSFYGIVF